MAQLIDSAFSFFNNRDLEEREEQTQHRKKGVERPAELIVIAVSSTIGKVQPPQGILGKSQKCQEEKD